MRISSEAWRKRYGFYPILPESGRGDSLLLDAVALGKTRGLDYRGHAFDTKDDLFCIADGKEWQELARKPGRRIGISNHSSR